MESGGAGPVWLIYGGSGWIGGHLAELLRKEGADVRLGKARLEDRAAVEREIQEHKPTYVLNAAGVTGRPNVDWCESNKQTTIRGNVLGAVNLADVCYLNGNIHCAVFGSGCIYEYDKDHPIGGKGFLEGDEPNYTGSFYSQSKIIAEKLLINYPNVLVLRLRMPISDDLHPRSFLTKISKYERVVNVPNSISILHDLLPISLDMAKKGRTGIYNFTNPGAISHNELLALYKEYIDPSFKWQNFSLEDQAKILKAGRSNNELDCTKLANEYPELKHIKEAAEDMFKRMQVIEGKKQ
jgi:3,5-epimerase/4-reductase